ncbi:MAG TPA: alpha-amylase family glycosyl hydrolase [Thermoanaerobaculia bacterium]|jgi:maltooligosyltrehalose trehalohydrolase|nr:alpha-amylase family glycosyl hydrolase [Thermoanaerobaculia bacterium]
MAQVRRRWSAGAEIQDGGVHFRVWAPRRERVAVVLENREVPLQRESDGFFAGLVDDIGAGALYRFRLDDDATLYPDPASRFQPEGPHGRSQVVDPGAFAWHDEQWPGVSAKGQVLYEMHVGTFTREGTWAAAAQELQRLRDTGITLIEMMPVNAFAGRFGWGYDGVDLWAPTQLYGSPDDLRAFIDTAHRTGLGVILDVVYNHLGPDGNFLPRFSPQYFTKKYPNEWGESINFDDEGSAAVREFFADNAAYWIAEFHLDGLRIDATQAMPDQSGGDPSPGLRPPSPGSAAGRGILAPDRLPGGEHVLVEIARRARQAAGARSIFIAGENEPQDVQLFEQGIDALWNDDFHHSAAVALTGRTEAYFSDYRGAPQELFSAVKRGFLYQGQWYAWQKKRRGTPTRGVEAHRFICFLENHDQLANTGTGARIRTRTSPGRYRAMMALLLLGPWTPMLFQGQETGSTRPFTYFADHNAELAPLVAKGRREFLQQFPSLAAREMRQSLPEPHDRAAFEACKLASSADPHLERLVRDLLELRRDPAFARQRADLLDGAVLSGAAFVLRFFLEDGADRLLLLNLGCDHRLAVAPEPLLASPAGREWKLQWSSESPEYGGEGTPPVEEEGRWFLPGECAVVLRS